MRSSAAPDEAKLHKSCDACTLSKLKCFKERPECLRGAKRGLACDFFAVKKAGRKPNSRQALAEALQSQAWILLLHARQKLCSSDVN